MASLRETMAENGFESNDDYGFQVRCLLAEAPDHIRTLAIEGDCERRKTAFATALARSLDFRHVLYHDFSAREPPPRDLILPEAVDEYGRSEPPIEPLDDIASEACALSEAEGTILILDQLQVADFREHIRIHQLIRDRQWQVRDAAYHANAHNLLLFLISELPLYHALRRVSLRVWIPPVSERRIRRRPADLGLGTDAEALFDALAGLFDALEAAPTAGEFDKLFKDLIGQVHTEAELRHALFGRIEGIDRARLYGDAPAAALGRVIEAQRAWLGSEQIVLGGADDLPKPADDPI